MRIGISDFRKWGEEHFARLAAYGFSCYDFNMADTEKLPYTLEDGDFEFAVDVGFGDIAQVNNILNL